MFNTERPRREYFEDELVFITSNVQDNLPIFYKDELAEIVVSVLEFLVKRGDMDLYAYVVMPNHIHLMFSPLKKKNYSQVMHSLKSYSSNEIKKLIASEARCLAYRDEVYDLDVVKNVSEARCLAYGKKVWQRSFYMHFILDEDDFFTHYEYIHYNPEKHGVVTDRKDYKWSSYQNVSNEFSEIEEMKIKFN